MVEKPTNLKEFCVLVKKVKKLLNISEVEAIKLVANLTREP